MIDWSIDWLSGRSIDWLRGWLEATHPGIVFLVSCCRQTDIQDHSKKLAHLPTGAGISNIGIFDSEKYSSPVHAAANSTSIPILHHGGMGEFSQLRRESIDRTITKRPSVDLSTPFENLPVRPEAGHLVRSSEEWDLTSSGKSDIVNNAELILEDFQQHGKEFSERFHKIGSHRNSLSTEEPSHGKEFSERIGSLSTEESSHGKEFSERIGSLSTEESSHGKEFSERIGSLSTEESSHGKKFSERIGSLSTEESSHVFGAAVENVSRGVEAPVSPTLARNAKDPEYERRLSIAREKWSLPAEDRARALGEVQEIAGVLGAPPTGQAEYFVREKRLEHSPHVLSREDKSMTELDRNLRKEQTFERVTSEVELKKVDHSKVPSPFPLDKFSSPILYYPVMLSHFLQSLGNYTRRAIFPEMCTINQSSVDFHCKSFGWLIDWRKVNFDLIGLLDWYRLISFYGGGAKVTQHNGMIQDFVQFFVCFLIAKRVWRSKGIMSGQIRTCLHGIRPGKMGQRSVS